MLAGFGVLCGMLGACASLDLLHMQETKMSAFEHAQVLSNGKGIINIGAGPHRSFGARNIARCPDVLVNIDIEPDGLPNFLQLDVETGILPFADKQFGCAFASHVLEHLDNWQFALSEMARVADSVVVVLPHPSYFSGWVSPEHKQHFSAEDIDEMTQLYPNIIVYY